MKIHHLDCGTMCPHGKRLITGEGGWLEQAEMCCHCLLIETNNGLVLVDSGLGTADVLDTHKRLGRAFAAMMRPRLDIEQTALYQVKKLGFKPADVRHIVVTHLDLDHAGGLSDFPEAQVHVFAPEHRAAMERPTLHEKNRYRPIQFRHQPRWVIHDTPGGRWRGFDGLQVLPGSGDQILLIPTIGHTRGHCAVAVNSGSGWLLHCGDAYFFREEMNWERPHCTPGLRIFQSLIEMKRRERLANQARLRQLAHEHAADLQLFCAHDPVELARLRGD